MACHTNVLHHGHHHTSSETVCSHNSTPKSQLVHEIENLRKKGIQMRGNGNAMAGYLGQSQSL